MKIFTMWLVLAMATGTAWSQVWTNKPGGTNAPGDPDPIWNKAPALGIKQGDIDAWNRNVGTNATSAISRVTDTDTNRWTTAWGWGNHGTNGYATGTPVYVESDPVFAAARASILTATSIRVTGAASNKYLFVNGFPSSDTLSPFYMPVGKGVGNRDYNDARYALFNQGANADTAFGWGNHATNGYLTEETDPVWGGVSGTVVAAANNGQTAFGWGFWGTPTSSIIPTTSNAVDLGSSALPFRHGYFGTNSVYLGTNQLTVIDGNLKLNGAAVSAAESDPVFLAYKPTLLSRFATDENNTLLNAFRIQALASVSYRDMIGAWVDGYVDQTGINTGASVNAYYASRSYKGYIVPSMVAQVLLHGNSDFSDSSANNLTPTETDSPSIDTTIKKFGAGSMKFASRNARVSYPDNAAYELGAGPWTLDFWLYTDDTMADGSFIFCKDNSSTSLGAYGLRYDTGGGGVYAFMASADGGGWDRAINTAISAPLPNDVWNHIAIVKNGPALVFYTNGVQSTSNTWNYTVWDNEHPLCVGSLNYAANNGAICQIDDFRIVTGTAAWVTEFTPPSEEHTAGVGGGITNLTLISTNYFAASIPTEMDVMIIAATNGAPTINTQVTVKVTANNGTNYQAVTLSDAGLFDSTKRFYTGTITNITNPGNRLGYKIETTNAVDASFYGASLMYR